MIAVIVLMTLSIIRANDLSINPVIVPDEKMPNWWKSESDQEQWTSFRKLIIEYNLVYTMFLQKISENDETLQHLNSTIDFMKKNPPYSPKIGVNLNGFFTVDRKLDFDFYLSLNAQIFFLRGHFYISPEITIKIIKEIGGGAGFGIGFVF